MTRKCVQLLLVLFCVFSMVSCADYQGAIDMSSTGDNNAVETEIKNKSTLGDFNDDGKEEFLLIEGSTIKLMSGSKIIAQFEPNKNLTYNYINAIVVDIDSDGSQEVVFYATVASTQNSTSILSVYVLDVLENGDFTLRDFPQELSNIDSITGINVQVVPKEKYIYEIIYEDKVFKIDTSRVYNLSVKSSEEKEKIDKEWSEIIENNYKGDILGIVKVEIIANTDNEQTLRIFEMVVGADGNNIGQVVFSITFDEDGTYEIVDVNYIERFDLQP